ncbi:MAG: 50S ribosomal protein L23 [Patescibacteria group bacterium]|nr:50S ribosomal protein L23 [Patescibacteria group bacterium]
MNKSLVKRALITEKSTDLSTMGKYVFWVEKETTAREAKKIVEQQYGVKVLRTNVINGKPKKRIVGARISNKPGRKKIIMTLQKGQKLDIVPQ